MHKVLVYKSELLQLSETFIKEQVLSYRRWQGVLVGMRSLDALPLAGLDVRFLRPSPPGYLNRLHWKLCRIRHSMPRSTIRLLKNERASLLHAHFGPEGIEAWPIARWLDVPMLVTLHGADINISRDWWEAGHGGPAMQSYPKRLIELSREPRVRFIAVSEAIRNRAISFGLPEDKISVRYIGVDPTRFKPSGRPIAERERRVLFVGRLVEKKGCEYLIRAFNKVQQAVPDASLVIIGNGPLRKTLQQLALDLNVCAQFRGALSSQEVQQELHLARVLCLPSITAVSGDAEGFGIVLLEAQASGVPVVTSALGGAAEGVREGVTGFTFQERDTKTLAARLITLLSDEIILKAMARAGPRFISDKFNLYRCTEDLEQLYDESFEVMESVRRWTFRGAVAKLPIVGPAVKNIYRAFALRGRELRFDSSSQYWDDRYSFGGNSGAGSYGRLALFKAEVINAFVRDNNVRSVIEFGCGDGAQLGLAHYPHYIGVDVSLRAVEICQSKFIRDLSKQFLHTSNPEVDTQRADLAMSLDVIYHLVEDDVYHAYMTRLVSAAERFVCVYSSNVEHASPVSHVRHRCFTDWMQRHASPWRLMTKVPNPYPEDPARPNDTSWADIYFFTKE
jgi:glycosyltransferase involved in cell wall biosynthesis